VIVLRNEALVIHDSRSPAPPLEHDPGDLRKIEANKARSRERAEAR
jgi:hypothetical protein